MSDYTVPNNHVFHTVMVWATTRLFGSSPQAIRIPVLIAGVLTVSAVWLVARALAGRGAGLFAAAIAAALPPLILYSTNARGYMLVSLAAMLLVWLGDRLLDGESPRRWIAFVVIGALGMWCLPVMLYPLGAVSLWLLAEHARRGGARDALRFVTRLGAAMAAVIVLTAMLYLPVILRGDVSLLVGNRFVRPLTWSELASQLAPFAHGMRELLGLGLPLIAVALAGLVALLGVAVPGEHRARRVTLAFATALWCCALMLATRRPPPPRILLFLAPLWCVYLGIGLSWLAGLVRAERVPVQAFGAVLVFGLLGVQVVRSRAVLQSEETDWIGMRDARDVAALVAAGRSDDRIVINRSSGPPLDYYLYHLTGQRLSAFMGEERHGRVLLVLDERHGQKLPRLLPLHPEVAWTTLGRPALLKQFPGASVYAFSAGTP